MPNQTNGSNNACDLGVFPSPNTSYNMVQNKTLFKIVTYVTETKMYESDVLAESKQVVIDYLNDNNKYNTVEYVNNRYDSCEPCSPCGDQSKTISKTVVREVLRA